MGKISWERYCVWKCLFVHIVGSYYHPLCDDAEENIPVIDVHFPSLTSFFIFSMTPRHSTHRARMLYRKRANTELGGQILVFAMVFVRCSVLLYNAVEVLFGGITMYM